nr:MAG TPA: hypothetical protein [Caudoviricetes sp.]
MVIIISYYPCNCRSPIWQIITTFISYRIIRRVSTFNFEMLSIGTIFKCSY